MRQIFFVVAFATLLTGAAAGGKPKFSADRLQSLDPYALMDIAAELSWRSLDSALTVNDIALEKALSMRDWVAVFYAIRERGIYFESNNSPENAIPEYEKAVHFVDSIAGSAREKYLPIAFTDLAIANRKAGNYITCQQWHERALALAQKTGDLELEEDSMHGLGFLFETVGDYERAIEWYQKSIEIAERRKSATGAIISYQNIAQTLLKAGNRGLALKKIEEAWQLALAQPDTLRRAHVLNDFGEILAATGAYDAAVEKFERSLSAYQQLGDQPMIARAHLNLANVCSSKNDSLAAFDHYEKSLSLRKFIRPEDMAKLLFGLGERAFRAKKWHESARWHSECLALAEQRGYLDFQQRAHLALSRLADQQNMPDVAFFHLKKATALADSLTGREKDMRVAEMEFRFNAERAKRQLHELKSRQDRFIFSGFTAVLVVGLGFLFWRNREKAASNQVLKQKSEEIDRQNRKLRESNAALQQFAYATAHDLREPLRTIGSFIGLIKRRHSTNLAGEALEYMQFVSDGAHRMNNLLTDLLEYSTICVESPATEEITSIDKALREVVSNLAETIRACGARVDLPSDLPHLAMQRSHAVQLFQNLIGNGIKFSPKAPHVRVHFERQGNELVFSVADNGIGIEKAYEGKVFQVFHRLHKQKFEGTGIGLAICKTIVEKYSGSISFESEPGEGAIFFVRFPARIGIEAAALNSAAFKTAETMAKA